MPLFKKAMHDPVEGTARVVNATGSPVYLGITSADCEMDLLVDAPGVATVAVHVTMHVKVMRWPEGNDVLPVTVDRADPSHLEVHWDRVRTTEQRVAAMQAKRLAAARHDGSPVAPPTQVGHAGTANHVRSAADVLAHGVGVRVAVQRVTPTGVANPQGDEIHVFVMVVTPSGRAPYPVTVGNPVPAALAYLAVAGADLPAKMLADDEHAVVIDWPAALIESGPM